VTHPAQAGRSRWTGAVAAWCALWLVVGVWTGSELWQLGDLGGAVAETGRALGSAGDALQGLGSTPLVGERTEELGAQVTDSSAEVVTQAEGARGSLRQLAVLLGLTVSLVPSVPAVVLLALIGRRNQQPSGS
jgi:hypothetical protein